MPEKEIMSINEAAKLLGVTIQTMRRWDESGHLRPDFVSPGGHRRYRLQTILSYSIDAFGLAERWAADARGFSLSPEYSCQNSGVFQVRLNRFQTDLQEVQESPAILSLIVAIASEIGNNSFDHNLGNWPDISGIFFAYDVRKKYVILADRGQGIRTTLKRVRPELTDDKQALLIAFTEIISGRAPEPRGNGLKFVSAVVKDHPITLRFQSGNGLVQITGGRQKLDITTGADSIRGTLAFITYT